jgi:sporulation protein YunB
MAFYKRHMGLSRKRKALLKLLAFLLAILMIYIAFNIKLVPVLKTTAVNRAKLVAINTINEAAGKVLKQDGITYDKLMIFDKDNDGNITAVEADTMQIDMLKYDITEEVIRELNDNADETGLKIPLGTVIGGQLLTGFGPNIDIRFQPVGNVSSEVSSSFSAAGINQTRQLVTLNITADITVVIASYNVSTQVKSSFPIADTVIVGNVPPVYVQ